VHIGRGSRRGQPGLRVHRGLLPPDEVTSVDGMAVTTPVRTASCCTARTGSRLAFAPR
jgi:hypothetical protein